MGHLMFPAAIIAVAEAVFGDKLIEASIGVFAGVVLSLAYIALSRILLSPHRRV